MPLLITHYKPGHWRYRQKLLTRSLGRTNCPVKSLDFMEIIATVSLVMWNAKVKTMVWHVWIGCDAHIMSPNRGRCLPNRRLRSDRESVLVFLLLYRLCIPAQRLRECISEVEENYWSKIFIPTSGYWTVSSYFMKLWFPRALPMIITKFFNNECGEMFATLL